MQKPNDLNQSRIVLKQDSTLIAVIEMSLSSWLGARHKLPSEALVRQLGPGQRPGTFRGGNFGHRRQSSFRCCSFLTHNSAKARTVADRMRERG